MASEIKCLTRGQKLTDAMIDHLAELLLEQSGDTCSHYIPTFVWRIDDDVDWSHYPDDDRVFVILNQKDHWFLLVREFGIFHLYDSLPSEEESVVDIHDLPIRDHDVVEDYYGSIPHQGESRTNCGVHALLNMLYLLQGQPPSYDPSLINKEIRPFLKKAVQNGFIDTEKLLSILS